MILVLIATLSIIGCAMCVAHRIGRSDKVLAMSCLQRLGLSVKIGAGLAVILIGLIILIAKI